jgi:hypothetical protein
LIDKLNHRIQIFKLKPSYSVRARRIT